MGKAFLVFGRSAGDVELRGLNDRDEGFTLSGRQGGDLAGRSVSAAGDVNGDGYGDLIIGSWARSGELTRAGISYVAFPNRNKSIQGVYQTAIRAGDAPPRAIGVIGDGSLAGTPEARVWIDYADGNGPSMETVTITRSLDGVDPRFATVAAPAYWEMQSDRSGVAQPLTLTFRYLDRETESIDTRALSVYHAENPAGPFRELPTQQDAGRRRVSAPTERLGYFFVAESDFPLFTNGFEAD